MKYNKNLGSIGEDIASEYLNILGYKIIKRNYRSKFGEIDIITIKDNILIFVEVKTRINNNYGYPIDSITKLKQKHIYNTAQYFLLNNKISYEEIRIDAIEVYISQNSFNINHVKGIIEK